MEEITQPAEQTPQQLRTVGWEIDIFTKASEGKVIIYPKDEKNVRLEKFTISTDTPEDEIKSRLIARGYDASRFTKKF